MSEQQNQKPTFDPSKNYGWEKEDTFTLSGEEFGFFYQFLTSKVKEAEPFLVAHKVLQGILEKGIEEGVIKEKEPEVQEETPLELKAEEIK